MSRSEISLKESAVSIRKRISSRDNPSRPNRCWWVNAISALLCGDEHDFVASVSLCEPYLNRFGGGRGQILAHVVGADRQLPVPAVDQHGELHTARPAEVHERIERCTHRAPGVQHVVDQHDLAVVDGKVDVGALYLRLL